MNKSLNDCFKEGLLKKVKPNIEFAKQSIKQAEHFLLEADKLIDNEMVDMAFIALYNSSFHASRALLFKDGVKERSHYCISKYIEYFYKEKELVTLRQTIILDSLREKRNDIQYSIIRLEIDEDVHEVYNEIEEFIERVKEIIDLKNTK